MPSFYVLKKASSSNIHFSLRDENVVKLGEFDENTQDFKLTKKIFGEVDATNTYIGNFVSSKTRDVSNLYNETFLPHMPRTLHDIHIDIIGTTLYRRALAVYVVQTSSKGTRFMVYLSDQVFHSAGCFGTGIESLKYGDLMENYKKKLEEKRPMIKFDPTKFGLF